MTRAAGAGGNLRDVDGEGILGLRPTAAGTPPMYFGKAAGGAPTGELDDSTFAVRDLGAEAVSADLNRDGLGGIIGTNSYLGISHGESYEQFATTLPPALVYAHSPGIEPLSGRFGGSLEPVTTLSVEIDRLGRGGELIGYRSDAEIALAVDFKLYVLVPDFERAASWPADPLFGNPAAADLLPQVADPSSPSGYRDVLRRSERWVEVPHDSNDDLSDGTGARFAVVGRTIQVFAENTGVFRAFIQASAL